MSERVDAAKAEPFERAKVPMLVAAVGTAGGLAIAGSLDPTTGGAIVLAAWVLGIASLHRLGRAGSLRAAEAAVAPAPVGPPPGPADD